MTDTRFIFVIGATNAGKTTLLDTVKALAHPDHATIEIGRRFRAKYPPEHFRGESNPKHTADEAWSWFVEEATAHRTMGKRFVWVDGQPRDIPQAEAIVANGWDIGGCYVHLYADESVRIRRAKLRDTDPAKLALSMARINGDLPSLEKIIVFLNNHDKDCLWYNTEEFAACSIVSLVTEKLS